MSAKYEGIIKRFERSYLTKESSELQGNHKEAFDKIITRKKCTACNGDRLNRKILSCKIDGKNIADYANMEVSDLIHTIKSVSNKMAGTMVTAISERLSHLNEIGLGYLFLNRNTSSLSGGESQRVKMVKHLGSSLTDMTYIFDEPSIGLHPKDVHQTK